MVSSRLSSFLSSRNFSGSTTNPAGSGRAPFVRSLLRAQEPDVFLPGLDEKPLDLAAVRDGLSAGGYEGVGLAEGEARAAKRPQGHAREPKPSELDSGGGWDGH